MKMEILRETSSDALTAHTAIKRGVTKRVVKTNRYIYKGRNFVRSFSSSLWISFDINKKEFACEKQILSNE